MCMTTGRRRVLSSSHLGPLEHESVRDAVLRQPGRLRCDEQVRGVRIQWSMSYLLKLWEGCPKLLTYGAHGEGLLGREGVEGALEAGRDPRDDDAGLAAEALGSAVDDGDDRLGVGVAVLVHRDQGDDHGVEPATGLHVVQARDDDVEALERARGGDKFRGKLILGRRAGHFYLPPSPCRIPQACPGSCPCEP